MLSVDEALGEVLTQAQPLPAERRLALEALGLTLAEDIHADIDLPPFDKALVDGYAIKVAEFESGVREYFVGEEILAGKTPERPLAIGEAAAIMTGAPIPVGADGVVMIERTSLVDGRVHLEKMAVRPGMNILRQGREMKTGDLILSRGDWINPARIGLLASVGRTEVEVIPPPLIRILPTGDELVEPGQKPGPGQIRNSNASMLAALVSNAGARAEILPVARDESQHLSDAISHGLGADVLLITGGVSAGNRDLVPETLESLGVRRIFHKVKLKPGKPLWFGVGLSRGDRPPTLVFGLPGNPVSGIVGFLLFVRPALAAMAGLSRRDPAARRRPLSRSFPHQSDRPTYHPSRLILSPDGGYAIDPLSWAGSADLRAVGSCDGFAVFPAGDREYAQGDVVDFLDLD